MRIAIHVDGPIIRGNERQVIRIAAGLRGRGHHVAVSCRAQGPVREELTALGIPTTGIRPGGDADLWNATRFAAWLRREGAEAVLLTSWKRTMIGAWAAAAARVPRIVYRIGDVHPIGGLERLALRRWYTDVIANSRAVADSVAAAQLALGGLDAGLQQITTSQTIVGARMGWIEIIDQRREATGELIADERADIGGADLATTMTRLQEVLTVLEASQASFVRVAGLSLFDKLRCFSRRISRCT